MLCFAVSVERLREHYERIVGSVGGGVLVAEQEGSIIGMCVFEQGTDTPYCPPGDGTWWNPFEWVSFLYVVPEHRRRGIATLLYEELARTTHAPEIMLDISEGDGVLDGLHRSLGFQKAATIAEKPRAEWTTPPPPPPAQGGLLMRQAHPHNDAPLLLEGLLAIYSAPARRGVWDDPDTHQQEVQSVLERHPGGTCRIIEKDGFPLGFFCFLPRISTPPYGVRYWPYHEPYTYLAFLYIRPQARGTGAGRAVMHFVEEQARLAGTSILVSTYEEGNGLAEKWHRSVGFVPKIGVFHIATREINEHHRGQLNQSPPPKSAPKKA